MANKPLYREVRDKLAASLGHGEWRPGEMLPSEAQLGERYGVGISTIRAAVGELEKAKVLVRAQGKGTFVLHFDERERTHRFLNIIRDDGTVEPTDRTLLSLERVVAPRDVAEALHLRRQGTKADVFRLTTLVRLGGAPVYHSSVFLPPRIFPKLRRPLLPDGAQSLYSLYQRNFNVNVTRVIDSLKTAPMPREVARLCAIPAGRWALRLERIAFTYDDVPVEMRLNWISTANHCYRIVQGDRS